MTKDELQANRIKTMRSLSNLLKKAMSGLTCQEYDAIRCCMDFIEMKYKLTKHDIRGGK